MIETGPRPEPAGLAGVPFAVLRHFRRGDFMAEAGCQASAVYRLRGGQAREFLLDEDGRETTTAIVGAGQLVGLAPLLGHTRHRQFAQALTDIEAWALPLGPLRDRLPHDPTLLGLALGAIVQRLVMALALLRSVLLPVAERVRDIEAHLNASLGGAAPALNRAALAGLIQARPETLARTHANQRGSAGARPSAWPDQCSNDSATWGFQPGQVVFETDLPRGRVGLVVTGQLQLLLAGTRGRAITADTLAAGDLFGLSSLLALPPLGSRLIALTAGAVQVLRTDEWLAMVADHPAVLQESMTRLGGCLERVERRLARARSASASQRLLDALIELAPRHGPTNGQHATCDWSHVWLAHHVGVRRETVTRALAELASAGAIRREGRRIIVLARASAVAQSVTAGGDALLPRSSDWSEHSMGAHGNLEPGGAQRARARRADPTALESPRVEPRATHARRAERTRLVWLPIDQIDEPPVGQNSRRSYQEESIAQLAASVREHGLLQPVCVRPSGCRYQVVFGVRRLRAALRAGLQEMPCMVQVADNDHAFLLNALENLHRQQLSGAERVRAIERLAATGLGVREISRRTGFNPSTISRWLRIDGCAELKSALEDGTLDIGRAKVLVEAPRDALVELIPQAPSLSLGDLRARVAALKHTSLATPQPADVELLLQAWRCLHAVRRPIDADLLEPIRHEIERLGAPGGPGVRADSAWDRPSERAPERRAEQRPASSPESK